jgi:PKD repeat protein
MSTTVLQMKLVPTFENIGIVVTYSGDSGKNNYAFSEYRTSGESGWYMGAPMFPGDGRAQQASSRKEWRGSILSLSPDTTYEVRVTFLDAEGVVGSPISGTVNTLNDILWSESSGMNYYVSPDGSDSNPGTSTSPKQHLSALAPLLSHGDTVYIRGTIYEDYGGPSSLPGPISLPSGTPSQYITITGEGTGVISWAYERYAKGLGSWYLYDSMNSIYRSEQFLTGGAIIWCGYGDSMMFPYASMSELQTNPYPSHGGYYYDGSYLYIRMADSSDPSGREINIVRTTDAGISSGWPEADEVLPACSYLHIADLNLKFVHTAVKIPGTRGCWIENNHIGPCARAVTMAGSTAQTVIRYNVMFNTFDPLWDWDFFKHNWMESAAIWTVGVSGVQNIIYGNECRGFFTAIEYCAWGTSAMGGEAALWHYNRNSDFDVYDNTVYDCIDDAIELDGGCVNARCYRNFTYNCRTCISVAPCSWGPLYYWRNRGIDFRDCYYKLGFTNMSAGYLLAVNNTGQSHYSSASMIAHGITSFGGEHGIRNHNFINEIMDIYGLIIYMLDRPQNYFENNLYRSYRYDNGGSSLIARYNGKTFASLATMQADQPDQDLHSVYGDPMLDESLAPLPSSPVISAGRIIPGVNDQDYEGDAPNIGAVESTGVPSPPLARFSYDKTTGEAPLTVHFTDMSVGLIDTWLWDFGDGHTSGDKNPTHIYTVEGNYTPTLTVTGPGGQDDSQGDTPIHVTPGVVTYVLTIHIKTITSTPVDGGTTEPAPGSYVKTGTVAVTALPYSDYILKEWREDDVVIAEGETNPLQVTMNTDRDITAVFEYVEPPPDQFVVSIVPLGNGTTKPSPGNYPVDVGTVLTLEAIPDPGNKFERWEGDISRTIPVVEITVNANMTVIAVFSEKASLVVPVVATAAVVGAIAFTMSNFGRRK